MKYALIFLMAASPALAETIPLNPEVTQATIQQTICVRGYTRSIRPPVSYTNAIKKERMYEMELPLELISDFQLDHRLPLSLGGHPSDPRNLVMQDADEAHMKDEVERCLPAAVCAGAVSLSQAQEAMWRDWRQAKSLCTVHNSWGSE
jgi:hypothetical protein